MGSDRWLRARSCFKARVQTSASHSRRRARTRVPQQGPARTSLQAAEHVQQRGRNRGRRRDGRAQALQARAAGVPLSVHMNPVLLKPQSDTDAQVVVQGRVLCNAAADEYQSLKARLMPAVMASFGRLAADADIVLVEGAGSASEVNLRANDIANMGFSTRADVPVVVIGDIDRGGVIASLVGTKAVLPPEDARMIEAFIVNKFRGDPALFTDGMAHIAKLTGWQPLGLVPYFWDAARLPEEDALGVQRPPQAAYPGGPASSCWPIRASRTSMISTRCGSNQMSICCSSTPGRQFQATPRWSFSPAPRQPSPIWKRSPNRMGYRPARPCASRRPGARHLWRLPDAWARSQGYERHRGTAGHRTGVGTSRRRHGTHR